MPAVKGCRAPRRLGSKGAMIDVMNARRQKKNLSELQLNWVGKGHLNAGESDLMYKYHVAHLSMVYGGRSKVNNNTPRSVSKPPPWANLDPRVLSPIPNKKQREARWDDKFFRGNCLLQNKERSSQQQCNNPASRPNNIANRRRPASAGVRRTGHEASGSTGHHQTNTAINARRQQRRPSSANARAREAGSTVYDVGISSGGCGSGRGGGGSSERKRKTRLCPADDTICGETRHSSGHLPSNIIWDGGGGGFSIPRSTTTATRRRSSLEHSNNENNGYSSEERHIIDGKYTLNDRQESTFRAFVAMLADFDTSSAVIILDDAFREAQVVAGLQDFTGCGED